MYHSRRLAQSVPLSFGTDYFLSRVFNSVVPCCKQFLLTHVLNLWCCCRVRTIEPGGAITLLRPGGLHARAVPAGQNARALSNKGTTVACVVFYPHRQLRECW
jgi:hypothetical protein